MSESHASPYLPPAIEKSGNSVPDRTGRKFYRPIALFLYCLFSLPVGLFLYGVNLRRRDERVVGYILSVLSAVLFVGILVAAVVGAGGRSVGILGLAMAFWVYRAETPAYRKSLREGGEIAKSWPPLLWAIGFLVLAVLAAALVGPGP